MLVYWLLFAFFAVAAGVQVGRPRDHARSRVMYLIGAVAVVLLVGLRYKVGADWQTYQYILDDTRHVDFWTALTYGDQAYEAINWMASHNDLDIWFVNGMCALVFAWGLFRFSACQANRWLALVIALPYMVIVVAMGYSRQGAALGVVLAGLADFLRRGSILRFGLYTLVAALFHSTAVVVFPLVAFAIQRNRLINILIGAAIIFLFYSNFIRPTFDRLIANYILAQYSSQGAAIRVSINLLAALVFWVQGQALAFTDQERAIWRNFAWASAAMVVALLITPSSTAIDRLSIYLMPLQIAVLSRIPMRGRGEGSSTAAVIAYSAAIQFVWLFFADHARFWLPYRSYLF